jgi:putative restriction endonuclease
MKEISVIVANITWNPYGWRNLYTNPKAGHKYAQTHLGHESLNFKFDKKGIDTADKIHGFVQWTHPPKEFTEGGIILFYSKNLHNNEHEIVGVYGNANILKQPLKKKWQGFERNILNLNIVAQKSHSLLFPIPLKAREYFRDMRSQVGYKKNILISLTTKIIKDELSVLLKSGTTQEEYKKLNAVYKLITGKDFLLAEKENMDENEQDELLPIISKQEREDIIRELINITPQSPEVVTFKGKQYKRDNKTIAQLKFLRGFKCQICSTGILTRKKTLYVEAAHIKAKHHSGSETLDNILILCPNHHKEFDIGEKKIIEHTKEIFRFELNEKSYDINFKLD